MQNNSNSLIFLMGMQRSGTNMVVWSLEKMPNTTLYNEDNPDAFRYYKLKDLNIPEELSVNHSDQNVIFKCLQDSYRISELLAQYKDSKILYIVRDVNSVVDSQLRAFKDEKDEHFINRVEAYVNKSHDFFNINVPDRLKERIHAITNKLYKKDLNRASLIAILWWVRNTIFFDQKLYNYPRVLLLKYSEVVQNPEANFKSICKFLELNFEQSAVKDINTNSLQSKNVDIEPITYNYCNQLWESINKVKTLS